MSTPNAEHEREITDLREQVADLQHDVLMGLRVRNAALRVAATFVLPGPDGQDYIDRERLVREWVDDGHDEVEAKDAELLALQQEVLRLRAQIDVPGGAA